MGALIAGWELIAVESFVIFYNFMGDTFNLSIILCKEVKIPKVLEHLNI